MKPPKQKKEAAENLKPVKLPARRRGQGDAAPTTARSYTVPFYAIVELRRAVTEHGSQGRALQVGSELASRMTDPPEVAEPDPELMVRMTYKLLPRTIHLIAELARTHYGTTGKAIAGCVKALRIRKLK